MKTISMLLTTFVLLIVLALQPSSRGVTGGGVREPVHLNRVSQTLVHAESGSDSVGLSSADGGIRSLYY